MTSAKQLDAEIEALKPLWRQAARDQDTCGCGAYYYGECGCGGYVETTQYVQAREIEYLRSKLLA